VEGEPNSLYLTVNQNRDLYEKLFLANGVKSATTKSPKGIFLTPMVITVGTL
jgi:hypothetical protein